jgi:hypothetical protein
MKIKSLALILCAIFVCACSDRSGIAPRDEVIKTKSTAIEVKNHVVYKIYAPSGDFTFVNSFELLDGTRCVSDSYMTNINCDWKKQ